MKNLPALLLIAFGVLCLLYGLLANPEVMQTLAIALPPDAPERSRDIPLPPVAGGLAVWCGAVLLVTRPK